MVKVTLKCLAGSVVSIVLLSQVVCAGIGVEVSEKSWDVTKDQAGSAGTWISPSTFTVQNIGTEPAKVRVRATNTQNWDLGACPSTDTYAMQYGTNPGWSIITTSDTNMVASLNQNSTYNFGLRYQSPTSVSDTSLMSTQVSTITLSVLSTSLMNYIFYDDFSSGAIDRTKWQSRLYDMGLNEPYKVINNELYAYYGGSWVNSFYSKSNLDGFRTYSYRVKFPVMNVAGYFTGLFCTKWDTPVFGLDTNIGYFYKKTGGIMSSKLVGASSLSANVWYRVSVKKIDSTTWQFMLIDETNNNVLCDITKTDVVTSSEAYFTILKSTHIVDPNNPYSMEDNINPIIVDDFSVGE